MSITTPRWQIDYHIARLLILLNAMGGPRRRILVGLTKLAKLDFLLRYPVALKRLIEAAEGQLPEGLDLTETETSAVESRMIRYKYGPWDNLYYPLVGALVGMNLAEQLPGSRGELRLKLTRRGQDTATRLAAHSQWSVIAGRAQLLAESFDISGNALKNRIYSELPELMSRPYRMEI